MAVEKAGVTDTCGCDFVRKHPSEHDFVLGIEDLDPIVAHDLSRRVDLRR